MFGKKIIMLSTSLDSPWGIAAVVSVYRNENLFVECAIKHLSTHVYGTKSRKIYTLMAALVRFLFLLLSGRVAAVHAHTASRWSFWRKFIFFAITHACGKPYLIHLHGAEFNKFYWGEAGYFARHVIKYVFDKSHSILVLSRGWKNDISKITTNENIFVVHNPVSLPKPLNNVESDYSILYLGSIEKRKGIYDLFHAVSIIRMKYPKVQVLIGGTGEFEKAKLIVDEYDLAKNVQFLGLIKGKLKEKYLNESQLLVLVSYDEGLPMSLLEAMSYGLPVLTSPVGGIPEAVDEGIEGFLVEPGDINSIASALDRLLSDPELRDEMGKAGRKRIENEFLPCVIFPVIKSIYRAIDPALVR